MRKFYQILIVFLLIHFQANAQSDCVDAIVICGNSNFSGLTATGFATQELTIGNACGFQETNSIWLKLIIANSGALSFILTPESTDIMEDFDFYLFGPNVNCSNLGTSIRCSTTNPFAANSPDNLTGMNNTETDVSEGPGPDGNNYVQSLNVLAGETYYLIIDRPVGISNFNMQWTGTSSFNPAPTANAPNNLQKCDTDGVFDETTTFDLTQNTAVIQGAQTNVLITYHTSQNDATLGINPILPANSYDNISNPEKIYARIINIFTECFETTSFEIKTNAPIILTNNEYAICDTNADGNDTNGKATFNITDITNELFSGQNISNLTIKYYKNPNDRSNNVNEITNNFENTIPNQQTIYLLITDLDNCPYTTTAIIKVKPLPIVVNQSLTKCRLVSSTSVSSVFNLSEADALYLNNNPNLQVTYYESINNLNNNVPIIGNFTTNSNPQIVFAKVLDISTDCYRINNLSLIVNTNIGRTIAPLEKCDALNAENGLTTFDLTTANLNLQSNESAKYYVLETDAVFGINAITTISQYPNPNAYLSKVFVRIDVANSCSGISELKLIVNKLPNIEVLSNDLIVTCTNLPNKFVLLTAGFLDNGLVTDFTYKWFLEGIIIPNATNATLSVNTSGKYTVEVTSFLGCSKTRTIVVQPSSIAQLIDTNVNDFVDFNSITVNVAGLGAYQYAIENTDYFQQSNFFDNLPAGIYNVYIQDTKADCGTLIIEVNVLGAPKFFSPNNDGFNDTWRIIGLNPKFSQGATLQVFDRFGKLLKNQDPNDSVGWDGNYDGLQLPSDDYWFVLELKNNRIIKGHFSLKR